MPAPLPTPVPARRRTARWALPSLLFLAGTLPYLPLLGAELVADGRALVEGHETLRTATRGPDRFLRLFREDYWDGIAPPSGLYRPLTTGALGIVFSVAGDRAWPYRLLGLLLHGALVLAAWRLAARALPPARAALAAAIYAVHPVHSEAVGDVANVGEMGAALLSLALLARVLGRSGAPPRGALAVDGLLFLASLLAKESAASTLLVVGLAAFLTPRGDPRRRGRFLVLLPLLAALLLDLALRTAALGFFWPRYLPTNRIENPLIFEPPEVRLPTAARILAHGLGLLVFPRRLSADYSLETFRLSAGPLDPGALACVALLLGLVAAAFLLRRPRPSSSLFLLASLASFAPTSNLLFPAGTIFAERHLLVPSLYLAIALLGLLPPGSLGRAWGCVAGVLLAGLAARTAARAWEWRSAARLTEVTARRDSPRSVRLLYNLAAERWKAGDRPAAVAPLERALEIYPAFYQARIRLGRYLLELGVEERGVRMLQEGLREGLASFPRYSASWSEAASTLTDALARRMGRGAEAVECWRAILAEFPDSPDARIELAAALDLARLPGAEAELREAARRRGGARIFLAQRLALEERHEEAIALLRSPPPPGEGWDARAQLLFSEGQALLTLARFGEAAAAFRRSLDLASNPSIGAAARAGLALSRFEEAQSAGAPLAGAIEALEEAAADPRLPEVHREHVREVLREARGGRGGPPIPPRRP